jgi:DNA-3-methyladenine glycosylase II
MSDEEVYAAITSLKGFGPWSAEMYMMFSMARPDIWPIGDLGIQEGLRVYLNKMKRPTPEQTLREGKRFAPYRTAASLLLWHLKHEDDLAKKARSAAKKKKK